MAITDYDNLSKDIAEGRGRSVQQTRATLEAGRNSDLPLFQRYIILDVIFDPHIVDVKKLEYWEHDLGVTNIKYGVAPPRNAIIARQVASNSASPVESAMILYPFFPPNLSLPCKPGEHVWVMFEDPTGNRKDLGYWMCRIVTSGLAEDVNHTHPHRAHDPSFVPGIKELFDGTDAPAYEFRNGSVGYQNGERFTVAETATLPGSTDAYKAVMTDSDGGKLVQYESIPRYRKRPGDYVLEGTNNTLIVLGRDRTGPVATYTPDESRGQVPSIPNNDVQDDGAGSIDLVAGRGQSVSTGGIPVDNDLPAKEIGKSPKEISVHEGDPDYDGDRSRVLISQRTATDTNFNLSGFNLEFGEGNIQGGDGSVKAGITDDTTGPGDGAIVIKSDKLRFIARSDVEILVTSFDRDDQGRMISSVDTDKYCAIVLKRNGDIILRPAASGYLKLGGDDASRGILCSDQPVTGENGLVQGAPLLTTMGGQVGGSVGDKGALAPGQGRWAAKVLIK
jgi:hypothetical protein